MGAGSSPSALVAVDLGEPVSWPCHVPHLLALWELTGHVSGLWRVNYNWKPLIQFGGLVLVRFLSPFSLWGTERIKRRGGKGVVFGENVLPAEKLHFLLNPLLSFMASSSFSIRPWKEWVVQAWTGLQRGLRLLRSASGKPSLPGLLSDAGFGWMASKPSHGSAHDACRSRRVPWLRWEAPAWAGILWATPLCTSVARKPLGWVCRCQVPAKMLCPALPTSLPWGNRREGLGSKDSFKRLRQQ